jgi:hypothetical protein
MSSNPCSAAYPADCFQQLETRCEQEEADVCRRYSTQVTIDERIRAIPRRTGFLWSTDRSDYNVRLGQGDF